MTNFLRIRLGLLGILLWSFGGLQILGAGVTDANWSDLFGGPGFHEYGAMAVNCLAKDDFGNVYIATDNEVVIKWDGRVGVSLGSAGGIIRALLCDNAGDLYAAGNFKTFGNLLANGIAKWDGTNWSALGSGLTNGSVNCLLFGGSGNFLYVGGTFTNAGNVGATNIAEWDGHNWSQVGNGLGTGSSDVVSCLAPDKAGNIYAVFDNSVKKWDGMSWSSLNNGLMTGNNGIYALTSDQSVIYAAVNYTDTNFVHYPVAKWTGTTWSLVGPDPASFGIVKALVCDQSGNLFAGGTGGVEMWNGESWSQLGPAMTNESGIVPMVLDALGNLYFGGEFGLAGGGTVNNIAKWNGTAWSALGNGMLGNESGDNSGGGFVSAVYRDKFGNIYVGGGFQTIGGPFGNGVVRWTGNAWSNLGAGIIGSVVALASDASGNLYAGGTFSLAGGIAVTNIAQWNGSNWSGLGSGIQGGGNEVLSIACDGSNILYAGGSFATAGGLAATNIAKWDGTAWSSMGLGINGFVFATVCDSDGNLYAGGGFTSAGGVAATNIAKWDGTAWSALGGGVNGQVAAMAVDGSGSLYVGGFFTKAGGVPAAYIAKWKSNTWSTLGSGTDSFVEALACDNLGNLCASGFFAHAGGLSANSIALWNGTQWSPIGTGFTDHNDPPVSMAFDTFGNLFAGGAFTKAGTNFSSYIAEVLLSKGSFNLSLTRNGGGTNVIVGSGTPGISYALDLATNLTPPVHWMPQTTNTLTGTIMNFTNVTSSPQGIYRTRFVQ